MQEWPVDKTTTRVSAVSSFGAGGANAHLIVEDYPLDRVLYKKALSDSLPSKEKQIIRISSRSRKQLILQIGSLITFFKNQEYYDFEFIKCDIDRASYMTDCVFTLDDIAMTLEKGRRHHHYRLAFVAQDIKILVKKLIQADQCLSENISEDDDQLNRFLKAKKIYFANSNDKNSSLESEIEDPAELRASFWATDTHNNLVKGDERANSDEWRKVPLPGYVFLRNRYWVENKHKTNREVDAIKEIGKIENSMLLTPKQILDRVSNGEMTHDEARARLQDLNSEFQKKTFRKQA